MKKKNLGKPRSRIKAILLIGAILIAATAIIRFRPTCMCGHPGSCGQYSVRIAAIAALRQLEIAVQSYELDHHELPSCLEDLTKVINTNGPYVRESELIDSWSQKFKYTKDSSSKKGFIISTTSPEGELFSNENEGWKSIP